MSPSGASALVGFVFTERGVGVKIDFGFIDMEERPLGELRLNRKVKWVDSLGGGGPSWVLIIAVVVVLLALWQVWEPVKVAAPSAIPTLIANPPIKVIFLLGLGLLSFAAGLTLLIWKIYSRRRRLTEDSVVGWEDSIRRGVRVSIGETRCLREIAPSETGLLIGDDLRAYPHLGCVFYRLEFSLTMLPDPGCSVERGQLSLELFPDNEQKKLPFFVRLHPEQEIVEEKKKLTRSGDGKATFKIPTIGEIEGGGKMETESELQVETVVITSWGAGEQLGGWRFTASATRSIKTNITGLTALVAIPEGRKSKGRFRAEARLRRARESADLLVPEPKAFIEYEFPPTLEIPSTPLTVSDPVPV
jgi:hypothetical protein